MLIGTSTSTAAHLTQAQSRTMFSIWSVMAAPLLIGSSIVELNAFDLETYSNQEVIAVDQDPLGLQGVRIAGADLSPGNSPTPSPTNIWGKKLQDQSWAIIFLNNANTTSDVVCDSECFAKTDFPASAVLQVRDLWQHAVIGTTSASSYTARSVPPNGGSVLLRFTRVQ
eukprot:TRINITY_DN947_c0_g2_i2.p1 TRINITY_DN947_c0_g2~~TRINITY_DN947_c0_g2_i2.p1  ORF type:complete len:169 (-),score=63.67 TRINITY_DN947_c0_g2_i2:87-593(-)